MRENSRQSKWFRQSRGLAGFLVCIMILVNFIFIPSTAQASTINKSVAGWVVYWDQTRGFNLTQNNSDIFDEISPFWYDVNANGELVPLWNSENSTMIDWAKSKGVKVIPLISNEFSGSLVSGIINNPSLKQTHINNIVKKVMEKGYDGIELDYESLFTADKESFSQFVEDLAHELHNIGKVLIVTVHPKTEAVGTWNGPKANDYVALGQAADKIRIMAYDYHYPGGSPGSIAPANWVEQVLAYSVTAIPKNKIVLGIPNYGYDWSTSTKGITYQQAINIANVNGAMIINDPINGPHYIYYVDGTKHEVWFENAISLRTKLDLVNKYDINGIVLWRLGGEDLTGYQAIREKFAVIEPTVTPTVAETVVTDQSTNNFSTESTTQTNETTTSTIHPIVVNPEAGLITPIVSSSETIPENPIALTPDPIVALDSISAAGAPTAPAVSQTLTPITKPIVAPIVTKPVDKKAPSLSYKVTVNRSTVAIKAVAKDNVKVAKVMFYVDGKLKFTDKTSPYGYKFKVKRTRKKHIIKVIAVDTKGNKTVTSKTIKW